MYIYIYYIHIQTQAVYIHICICKCVLICYNIGVRDSVCVYEYTTETGRCMKMNINIDKYNKEYIYIICHDIVWGGGKSEKYYN